MLKLFKPTFLLLLLIISQESLAQIKPGYYYDTSRNFINFKKDNIVEFRFSNMKGQGFVEIKNRKLTIHNNKNYSGGSLSKFIFSSKVNHQKGEYDFLVRDFNNDNVFSAGIYVIEREYEHYFKEVFTSTDSSGRAHLHITRMPEDSILYINGFHYNPLKIKLNDLTGGHFDVNLAKGEFVYAEMDKLKLRYKIYNDTIQCRYKFKVPGAGSKSIIYRLMKQNDTTL